VNGIISGALKQPFLVLALIVAIVGYGTVATLRLNVDAFPDVTNIQVQVNTEAPGLAALEVEQLITFPIESVMGGLPDVQEVRSISQTGLSSITVVFADHVDTYFARQLILERLQAAKERIPEGLAEPEMGPITTGLGEVYKYILTSEKASAMELRTLNDWLVKFQLRTVPGVAEVLSNGGEVRQYQVMADPHRLLEHDLGIGDLRRALQENNSNAGGWYLEGKHEQLVVRGEGMIRGSREGLEDIENIVLKSVTGTPVYIRDVAHVQYGAQIRQGAVTMNGAGEVVMGIVVQLKGANTKRVIEAVRDKIASIAGALPEGVKIVPVYDQADLVEKSISTVRRALLESAVLIVIVLFLFLWNLRSALILVATIPLSMLIAFIMMRWYGLSANLQSLGGLAIGIGMMVDSSLVVVENVVRRIAHDEPSGSGEAIHIAERIRRACIEVGAPVFFSGLIIVVSKLPLFTLQGIEGKLFRPLAFTIAFAMLGALLVALTAVPVLCVLAFRKPLREEDPFLMRWLKGLYEPLLCGALAARPLVVALAVLALVASLATLPFLGTEFAPELDEGTLSVRVTMSPSIALEESKRIATRLERRLLKYPEVTYALSQIGRAELGGEPEAISNNEIAVGLKPQAQWTTAHTREELIHVLSEDLNQHPGVLIGFSQPIATRVEELLSGVKAQIAIKLFGEDLKVLEAKAREIQEVVEGIAGATDVQMQQLSGEEQLVVRPDRGKLARYGLNVADVMEIVSTAVGGEAVTQVVEGQRRFDVYLRVAEPYRDRAEAIGNLWVSNEGGMRVPLSQVSSISWASGPPTVSREDAQRRIVVQCNVRGRDMGGFVQEARAAVAKAVHLPPGYLVTWGGQFENQQRAQRTLLIVIPVSIATIFLLLYLAFGNLRSVFLILLNVPFALVGGIFALAISGQYLSVPASVGFIALFGTAVQNGVVMVACVNELVRAGAQTDAAVIRGAMLRLRPILMTAVSAALGLVPLLLSTGIGSEVQRPLATVVVGGLASCTVLTLLVIPVLYPWFAVNREPAPQQEEFAS
jgi:heavy metal efflux system protein